MREIIGVSRLTVYSPNRLSWNIAP